MNTSVAYANEARYELLRVARLPGFALPTILFPVMFYVFFGLVFGNRGGGPVHMPTYLLATYGTFGVIGPALFGFGVSLAVERGFGWLKLRRATPMPPSAYLLAKLFMAVVFAMLVAGILAGLGAAFGGVRLTAATWLSLLGALTVGCVPFCAMGLAIGAFAGPQSAPAVVNLLYLPMSLLSGLWMPLRVFPPLLQKVATFLPPYHLGEIALGSVGLSSSGEMTGHVLFLLAFGLACLGLAAIGLRRDQA